MNRGNRYKFLRFALVLVIVGLVIAGACIGSPRARQERQREACPEQPATRAVGAVRTDDGKCHLVSP